MGVNVALTEFQNTTNYIEGSRQSNNPALGWRYIVHRLLSSNPQVTRLKSKLTINSRIKQRFYNYFASYYSDFRLYGQIYRKINLYITIWEKFV